MVVTPLPRRPFVSRPTRTTRPFALALFFSEIVGSGRFILLNWRIAPFAATDETSDQVHHFSFHESKHLWIVIDFPELDLLDPGRESLLKHRQMLGLFQSHDEIGLVEFVGRHFQRKPSKICRGPDSHLFECLDGDHGHRADVPRRWLRGQRP